MFNTNDEFVDYVTYNRKLKLEEYDEDGNLIDCVEFSKEDLFEFYILKNNSINNLPTARKNIKDYFKVGNVDLKHRLLRRLFLQYKLDQDLLNKIDSIIETYNENELNFALDFKKYYCNESTLSFTIKDYNIIKKMSFFEVLNWIRSVDGLYYTVDNDGTKGMTYLIKPTKKQAIYQRKKNGKRILFLSFTDWKEYLISEDELS